MLIGIAAAVLACLGYGTASVLQGYGARQSATNVHGRSGNGAPSLSSTIAAMLTPAFIAGMVLDLVGFAGTLVSARLIPLFLSQTIMSANLAVTAVLGIAVLGVRLQRRDWLAISAVLLSLCVLALTAGPRGEDFATPSVHWGVLIASVAVLLTGLGLIRVLGSRAAIPAGLLAGILYGAMSVAVRVLDGLDPLRVKVLLSDPVAYAVILAGVGGFYLFTVALQVGSVNGAAAALVVGETVVPGVTGVLLLGDGARPGLGWLVAVAFVVAVVSAVSVAAFGAVENTQSTAPEPAR
ncbi:MULTISPECIES: hypothetical protein [Mycobacteroides]|uniref:Integral membrane protein n=1 Tax=Mycobacteroides chelonae TaxID=1774 RepID=A0A1S1LXZ7_MYCCH|nr:MULTISPECIES: hypothetical protein [Mycobacteroides]KRQ25392.1 hypothetical protein AOT87_09490 [Mycobacteroides sp. H003]KRQ31926.1 hypothetical protein AOT91_12605 [Mycobacteroides sp. H092]KRQ34864.1 hypothetical protein AOT92_25335 [Mycobacteroides sp. H101]KRQ53253.1 hypothetical protein AOT88_01590 [Mycobacteroides sp. H063]KRQ58548.1 hypothetical protein AOT89_21980 [Mycobacteroides sp. H070]